MREPRNKARGEVMLAVSGRGVRLCVTLGALAELEAAFDVASIPELAIHLEHLSASDLITVLSALTAGGGAPMSLTELAAADIDPRAAAAAVAAAFAEAFGDA
jgi:hypothetical protein